MKPVFYFFSSFFAGLFMCFPVIVSAQSLPRPVGGNNVVANAPCVNEDFESSNVAAYTGSTNATAISGWTISSYVPQFDCKPTGWVLGSPQIWVISTPITSIPGIGTLSTSPLGGTKIVQLNSSSPMVHTRIRQTFAVTATNNFFQFAFAGFYEDGGHGCCGNPGVDFQLYDCSGTPNGCQVLDASAGACTPTGADSFTNSSGSTYYTNWQVKYVDLTPYIGSCVTVEFISRIGYGGAQYGVTYLDTKCSTQSFGTPLNGVPGLSNGVSYCPGSTQAILQAPPGYSSFQWASSTGSITGATGQTYTVTNASPNAVYTAILGTTMNCAYVATYTIHTTTVNISGVSTVSSCPQGTTGSAAVTGNGSGTGYNYSWTALTNTTSVIGTSNILSNIPAGVYHVSLTAIAGCGSASAIVVVTSAPQATSISTATYCGIYANLSGPAAGSSYHWYQNGLLIPGNTSSICTVGSPATGNVWLSYFYQGCRDSVHYQLTLGPSGAVNVVPGGACPAASTATATISMSAAPGAPGGSNGFTVTSTGTNTPVYSVMLGPVSPLSYTAINLYAGGSYSVVTFDGSCYYSASFTTYLSAQPFTYSLSQNTTTICDGQAVTANVTIANPLLYTYVWLPAAFISNSSATSVTITPTGSSGTVISPVYSVIVTPTVINCPETQTLTFLYINPVIPTITPLPALCTNMSTIAVSVNPPGGVFTTTAGGTSPLSSNGVLTPLLAGPGVHSFTYSLLQTCPSSATATYVVNTSPTVSVSGKTITCSGESATLQASGAATYSWQPSATGATVAVTPTITGIYTVTGTSSGCSTSKTVTITVEPCTGIRTTDKTNELKIYPNPAVSELFIETELPVSIAIYDALGKVILEQTLPKGKSNIDLSSFSSGVYMLRTSLGDTVKITKLIKTN